MIRTLAVLGLCACLWAMAAYPPNWDGSQPDFALAKITPYCPHGPGNRGRLPNGQWADRWGGGPNSAWLGTTLQKYHCAVDPRRIPYGTILWVAAPYNRMLLAVDCGGAVKGMHVDVCIPDAQEFWQWRNRTCRAKVWRIGRVTKAEAREWTPPGGEGK